MKLFILFQFICFVNITTAKLSSAYAPAVIQVLGYYVEQLQYEQLDKTTVEPPLNNVNNQPLQIQSVSTSMKPHLSVTDMMPTSTTTLSTELQSEKPTNTQSTSHIASTSWWQTTQGPATFWWQKSTTPISVNINIESSTQRHPPGNYAPFRPVAIQNNKPVYEWNNSPTKNPQELTTQSHIQNKPILNVGVPMGSPISDYLISGQQHQTEEGFYNWFFQTKAKYLDLKANNSILLDILPREILMEITSESENLPAVMDYDNVKEFLRKWDDRFPRRTGNKRVPVTAPFVNFIILYDILKRESKKMKLNEFNGYDDNFLNILSTTSGWSSSRQLHTLMTKMIANNEIERTDILRRCNVIIKDLENPNSMTSKAMLYIPALKFLQ